MSDKPAADQSPERAPASDRPPVSIKSAKKKVAEGPENLRRREAWFQKRAGGRVKRPSR